MKRFWKTATGTDQTVALDGRPVRTPRGSPLTLPTQALADAIAAEWNAVGESLDPRAIPLTGLANAAIDIVAPDPAAFVATLAVYAETDLLAYRADRPAALVTAQAAAWDPLVAWARQRFDVHIDTVIGILHRPQPPATVARLQQALAAHDVFALAGLSPLITIGGSLIAALALAEAAFDADTVWLAVHHDEYWQESQWGEDALATAARATRRADYDAAVRFLRLIA